MKTIKLPEIDEIKAATRCYWSKEDESFIVESLIFRNCFIGVGSTVDEAYKDFAKIIDECYDDPIVSNKLAGYNIVKELPKMSDENE